MESDVVGDWWSVVDGTDLVKPPSLVSTIVAVPEDDMSVVGVGSTVDIEALSSVVLEVSAVAIDPSDSVLVKTLVWSGSSSNSDSEVLTKLVSNAVSSLRPGSDGLGSSVEGPPLFDGSLSWILSLYWLPPMCSCQNKALLSVILDLIWNLTPLLSGCLG